MWFLHDLASFLGSDYLRKVSYTFSKSTKKVIIMEYRGTGRRTVRDTVSIKEKNYSSMVLVQFVHAKVILYRVLILDEI
jgi:hypothetical protein